MRVVEVKELRPTMNPADDCTGLVLDISERDLMTEVLAIEARGLIPFVTTDEKLIATWRLTNSGPAHAEL